tara:strand:- start:525 stop:2270 length:1746 start_codon:yes stop_codon:yes gene_type:complete
MMVLDDMYNWMDGVLSEKIPSGDKMYKGIKRHFDWMENKDFPYFFNESAAIEYIQFLQQMRFVEGTVAGQNFLLAPFQKLIVGSLFGWQEKDTGKRQFTDSYLQVAKKNAKTTLGGAILLTSFYKDPERRAQYTFCATSRDQANIAFNTTVALAREFAFEYEDVESVTAFYANSLQRSDTGSYMRSISKDAKNVEGRGTYIAFADERHLHDSDSVINNVMSGQAIEYNNNNLMIRATTAGNSIMGVCHQFYINVASKVLDGIVTDDNLFIFIAEMNEQDWSDLEALWRKGWPDDRHGNPLDLPIWQKANPNCPVCPSLKFLRKQFERAMVQGGKKIIDVKTKHANMWCSTAVSWMSDELFMKGAEPEFQIEDTYGMEAYIGLDLSRTTDLSVVFLNVVDRKEDGKDIHYAIPFIFIPETKMNEEEDKVDYAKWAMEGVVIVAGEKNIDDRIVEEKILWIIETWNVKCMRYDVALVNRLINSLKEKVSTEIKPIPQSYAALTPPTSELEKIIAENRLRHNGHPAYRWMFSNVFLDQKGDYKKITKQKCISKVDAPVAHVFALGGYIFKEPEEELEAPTIIVL